MFVILSQLYDIAWASAVAFFIIQILNLFRPNQKDDSGRKYEEGEIASEPNAMQMPHEEIWSIEECQTANPTDNNTFIDSLERSIKTNEELLMQFEKRVGDMVKLVDDVELILAQDRETMFNMCAKGKTLAIDTSSHNHLGTELVSIDNWDVQLKACIPRSHAICDNEVNKKQLFKQQEVSLMECSDIDEQETENLQLIRGVTSSSTLDLSSSLSDDIYVIFEENDEEMSQEIEDESCEVIFGVCEYWENEQEIIDNKSVKQNIFTKLLSTDGNASTKKNSVISITYQSQLTINSRFLQDIGSLAIENFNIDDMRPYMVYGQFNCATLVDDDGGELIVVGSNCEDVEGSKMLFVKQSEMYESDDDDMLPWQFENPLKRRRFNILSMKPLRQHLIRILQQIFRLKVHKRTNSSHGAASWSEI